MQLASHAAMHVPQIQLDLCCCLCISAGPEAGGRAGADKAAQTHR